MVGIKILLFRNRLIKGDFSDATKQVPGREITEDPMRSSTVCVTSTELANLMVVT